jgi:hypothetical protein
LLPFPSSSHDDLLDATEIALSLVGHANMYRFMEEEGYYPPTARNYWKHKMPQYKGVNILSRPSGSTRNWTRYDWEKYIKF